MGAWPAWARRAIACCCLALAALPSLAQQLRQDTDYRLIPQQPVAAGNKIEVIEFFWYGCPYCNELQPALEAWLKHKPADVEFRLIPPFFIPSGRRMRVFTTHLKRSANCRGCIQKSITAITLISSI